MNNDDGNNIELFAIGNYELSIDTQLFDACFNKKYAVLYDDLQFEYDANNKTKNIKLLQMKC